MARDVLKHVYTTERLQPPTSLGAVFDVIPGVKLQVVQCQEEKRPEDEKETAEMWVPGDDVFTDIS